MIKIGDRTISERDNAYIIAEAGINHNGDIDIAKKLIYEAKNNGADAIKFQKRNIYNTYTKKELERPYIGVNSFGKTYGEHKMFLEFSNEQYDELYEYSKEIGIDFMCTGFDITAYDDIDKYVKMHKVASAFINYHQLLEHVASFGKPVVLSTGMHTLTEIINAVNCILPINKDIVIMQCTTGYPIEYKDVNLNVLHTYKKLLNLTLGYSSHDVGIISSCASIALGACVIEKHFTLDRGMKGTDQKASIEPKELKMLREYCDCITESLGSYAKIPTEEELKNSNKLGVSWTSKTDIKKGDKFTVDNLCIKCPGIGVPPTVEIYGKTANKDIESDVTILDIDYD